MANKSFSVQDLVGVQIGLIWILCLYCDITEDMDVTLDRVEDNLVRTDDKWVIFMDSNAYNELWGKGPFGSTRQKTRGTKLARWIEGNDVRIHNDPSMPTFIRPVPGGGVNGYQSSSIDVCLSSEVDIVGWSTVDGVRPYDHLLIEAMAVTDKASIKVKRVYTRIKDKPAYYDDLKSAASDWYHDLPDFMLAMDIDVAIADVVDKIKTVKNRHCSEHSLEVNLDSPDWWGDRLTALRKEVRSLQRAAYSTGCAAAWYRYRKARNHYNKEIRRTRTDWFYKQLSNERDYGRILKKRAKPKASSLVGSTPSADEEVFRHHTPDQPCHDLVTKPASDQEIERVLALIDDSLLEEVWDKLGRKRDSSPGLDGIVYSDIRECGQYLRLGLEKIFRHMVWLGYFPEHGKDLAMILLWKGKGDLSHGDSYRPIGMSSCLTKYLEMLMVALISRFEKALPPHSDLSRRLSLSYGYVEGKDTSMAVQKATEVMKQLTDEGKAVIALSLDMRGAFSNARHDVICTTVEEMCGSPVLFNLVSSYLHRRRCFYKGKMRLSMSFSGTPQGGVVSPCVYRIFHTVLMGIIESCSTDDVRLIPIVYADDTLVILSGDNDQAVVEAVGRLLDTLAEQLPALGLNISEEKSVLLGDKAFIERYDCVRGIKVRPAIGYLGMRLTLGGSWLPHFEEAVARARREIEMCRRLVGKDGCSALSPKGREVIRNHITGVLAYGLVCWGDRLRFKTTRDRISAVDLRLEKVLLGVPGTANPGLCALLSDRKATIYERLCVRYASLWLRGLPPSPKWWGTVVKQPYPVKGTVDHTVTNATPLPRGWVHIGNGCEVTGTITEGLAGGKVIFPEVEVVIYTDGSRTPAVDDNDDDTTRVGAGYYSDSELIGNGRVKLPHFANIAQAESLAVLEAMRKAAESGGFSTILIASDSQAILKSLLSRRKSQLSSDIVDLALSADIDFRFIWVRGHAGSTGNSIADGMARSGSIVGTFRTVPIPGSHLRELVSQSDRSLQVKE
ncbi:hypothetical protein FOZ61_000842 [Perkinsus olseni]|uniref:Uncharacterized protein n=2 Tax=Perkinsus olseni TaxID=32597 RepID=A0A7J6KTF8_PEROL|nr:hypothetical protein FOZ61_000842 [Perkinsus olseni]